MARKTVVTLLLLIFGVAQLWATPKDSIPQRLSADIRPAYNIISHYALRGIYTNGDALESALSANLQYSFSLPKRNPLSEIYPTAYQGIGVGVYTFYHDNFTGTPIAIYILQGARIADFTERLSLGYEWNLGASWGWLPNEAMNSRYNVLITLSLPLSWRIGQGWELYVAPYFNHFSNADTHFSNSGANLFGLRLGATYHFNEDETRVDAGRYISPSERYGDCSFAEHLSYDIILYGGWRADRFTQDGHIYLTDKALPLGGMHFQPHYHLNDHFAIGASLDIQVDSSLNLYAITTDDGKLLSIGRPTLWEQTEIGLSLRGEIKAPIFTIGASVGLNINKQGYDMSRLYTQFSLKAFLTQRLFLYVGYRFNSHQYTHNMMYGLGIRL